MGPVTQLLKMGATVIAVDINIPFVWKKLFAMVKDSPGKLIYPLTKPSAECKDDEERCSVAGCNLLEQPQEITNWVVAVAEAHCGGRGGPVVRTASVAGS